MTGLVTFCLVVAHFVCPLLFFTNLTRNPYVAQICLLNVVLATAAAAWLIRGPLAREPLRVPRTPLDAPWLALLAACAASWTVAYFGHRAFYRPAIVNEGSRSALFLLFNSLVPFYLSAAVPWDAAPRNDSLRIGAPGGAPVSLGWWALFTLAWGGLWLAFPQMRSAGISSADTWAQAWDPYGGLLWATGLIAAFWLCRRGRVTDFLHLALAAGFLASAYGIFQYFNIESIWPNVLNPYGGRSVSSFGNPNFLSSYNVALLPVAVVSFIEARSPGRRIAYGVTALTLEGALLCTMTRSSWVGALAAVLLLAVSPDVRRSVARSRKPCGLLAGAGLALVLLWPASSISAGYTPSVVSRITEMSQAAKIDLHYSPLYQRLLIWGCAWLMGAENPLTGKGWGLFELFYPFYQGHLLNCIDLFAALRTHANNAHNEILEIWSQTGLLGLGIACWMWVTFIAVTRRWAAARGRLPSFALAAAAGAIGMWLDNLLNVSLHFAVPGFIYWWMAGLVMGSVAPEGAAAVRGRWRSVSSPAAAGVLAAAGVALALVVSWQWFRVWNREVDYFSGYKLLRQGVLPLAVKKLEAARDWGPPEVNAIYELGNVYARSERFAEAERTYAEALRANAGYDEIYFNIGTIKAGRLQDPRRALDYYLMAWRINPLSPDIYNSLGAIWLQDPVRNGAQAQELLERGTHFFPGVPQHWHNLGYLYALERRWPEAIAAYSRALVLAPDMAASEQGILVAAAKSGRPKPAVLEGVARLRGLESQVNRGDYSAATLDLALRLAARFPEMTKARFLAGSLLLVAGRPADAVAQMEWVVAKEPRHVAALINLAHAYHSLGRNREAAAQLRAVLDLDPGNATAREGLRALGPK